MARKTNSQPKNFSPYGDDAAYITRGIATGTIDAKNFDQFIAKHSDWVDRYETPTRDKTKVLRNLRTNFANVAKRFFNWRGGKGGMFWLVVVFVLFCFVHSHFFFPQNCPIILSKLANSRRLYRGPPRTSRRVSNRHAEYQKTRTLYGEQLRTRKSLPSSRPSPNQR